MVGTRRSVAQPNPDESPPPPAESAAGKILKSLSIAGNAALLGEKVQHSDADQFYIWRGVKYLIDANTKPEWLLEGQLVKSQKRQREPSHQEDDKENGAGAAVASKSRKTGDKRVRGDTVEPPKKRQRRENRTTIEAPRKKQLKREREEDEEDIIEPRAKKQKRGSVATVANSRRTTKKNTGAVKKEAGAVHAREHRTRRRNDELESSDESESNDELDYKEDQRLAAARGFNTIAFPESKQPEYTQAEVDAEAVKAVALIAQLYKLNEREKELIKQKDRLVLPPRIDPDRLAEMKAERDRILAAAAKATEEAATVASPTATHAPNIDKPALEQTVVEHIATQTPNLDKPALEKKIVEHTAIQTPKPDEPARKQTIIECSPSPPPKKQSPSPADSGHESATQDLGRALHLPRTNRGGQVLRWSLPAGIGDRDDAQPEVLSERLHKESHSARRRRVKRERAVLEAWRVKKE